MGSQLKDLASKSVAVVEPETTAVVAASLMRQHHIGALVVVDAVDKIRPVGIVTDRDLVLELMAEGLDPAVFTVGDIMSVDLVTAAPELDVMQAVQLMQSHRLRRLVVTDADGALTGIVTMEDVLQVLARELADLAAGLTGARDRETRERH
jgi:CBS domain-containing protein